MRLPCYIAGCFYVKLRQFEVFASINIILILIPVSSINLMYIFYISTDLIFLFYLKKFNAVFPDEIAAYFHYVHALFVSSASMSWRDISISHLDISHFEIVGEILGLSLKNYQVESM